jgi:KUP system potassium uptake protein
MLYADMGHFGRLPIRLVWSCLVFPALLLNYAGQAAIVLAGAPTEGSIFFRLCPAPLLLPLVLLATAATVIASQAVITGDFSITRQAIQRRCHRLQVIRPRPQAMGNLPPMNWLLMLATLSLRLALTFERPCCCLWIAVSGTMLAAPSSCLLPCANGDGHYRRNRGQVAFATIDEAFCPPTW